MTARARRVVAALAVVVAAVLLGIVTGPLGTPCYVMTTSVVAP